MHARACTRCSPSRARPFSATSREQILGVLARKGVHAWETATAPTKSDDDDDDNDDDDEVQKAGDDDEKAGDDAAAAAIAASGDAPIAIQAELKDAFRDAPVPSPVIGGATPDAEVPVGDAGMRNEATEVGAAIDITRSPSHRQWDGQRHRASVVVINVARMLNPTSPYAP